MQEINIILIKLICKFSMADFQSLNHLVKINLQNCKYIPLEQHTSIYLDVCGFPQQQNHQHQPTSQRQQMIGLQNDEF